MKKINKDVIIDTAIELFWLLVLISGALMVQRIVRHDYAEIRNVWEMIKNF